MTAHGGSGPCAPSMTQFGAHWRLLRLGQHEPAGPTAAARWPSQPQSPIGAAAQRARPAEHHQHLRKWRGHDV
eukprot:6222291-Karenia_brevis.AAC.1